MARRRGSSTRLQLCCSYLAGGVIISLRNSTRERRRVWRSCFASVLQRGCTRFISVFRRPQRLDRRFGRVLCLLVRRTGADRGSTFRHCNYLAFRSPHWLLVGIFCIPDSHHGALGVVFSSRPAAKSRHLRLCISSHVAVGFGLVSFLGYGTSLNPSGETKILTSPFLYLANYNFFWLPTLLIAKGVAPVWAGVTQFALLVIVQAGFLTPFLAWRISASRRLCSPLEVLLFGAGLAGIAAVFFLESGGGSQFTFLHYSTLAFSLLGGIALSEAIGARTRRFFAAVTIASILALVQITELPFHALSGIALRLAPASSPERRLTRLCDSEPNGDSTELVVPAGASVVLPANVGICQRLRFTIKNPRANSYVEEFLRHIAEWETSLKSELTDKVALLDKGPAVLAATLPSPSYVMVSRGAQIALERHDSDR